jgi:SOS response regulatory protein OraA/RecX
VREERSGESAYGRALARLARRDATESELVRGLLRDGFPAEDVAEALGRLRQRRLVDDRALAARFAKSRLAHHGQGRHRIRHTLSGRGVARPAAEAGLRGALQDVPEAEVLESVARRYWRQRAADPPRLRLRKLWAFLLRRGFPAELVRARLQALWPRWRDALEDLEIESDE